jgi:hypothetical protein
MASLAPVTIGWAVGDGGAIFKRDNATAISVPGSMVIPRGPSLAYDLALRTIRTTPTSKTSKVDHAFDHASGFVSNLPASHYRQRLAA